MYVGAANKAFDTGALAGDVFTQAIGLTLGLSPAELGFGQESSIAPLLGKVREVLPPGKPTASKERCRCRSCRNRRST
jgi:hypothetical protein